MYPQTDTLQQLVQGDIAIGASRLLGTDSTSYRDLPATNTTQEYKIAQNRMPPAF